MATKQYGHYEVVRKLGEGGMGVVYAAHDARLGRMVAVKTLHAARDTVARKRLWREARAAAGISHPNVCQVYDVGEEGDELYVAMELLDGEPLAARIVGGALPVREAVDITLGILSALEALHRRELVHRDLKPSNVFLTEHGVKLLDFGLVRSAAGDVDATDVDLTHAGTAVGTPRYMAPEQWSGGDVGPACDLFAAGAVLFEMLTGKPAFGGATVFEIHHAIVHEQPPALVGGAEVMALDRLIQRALAKRPQDRLQSAVEMADALRQSVQQLGTGAAAPMRALTRLVVLPFRMLRPDPDIDFLSLGLADAVTASLSSFEAVLVRSSASAARYQDAVPDLTKIASEAGVDAVLYGTLMRAGEQVRVTSQLVQAPSGALLCTHTAQVKLQDLFQLQDDLAAQIVQSLALPLGRRKGSGRPEASAKPKAYEYYLRANQLGMNRRLLAQARDLYRCALDEDPRFAAAWARLGRVHRVMAKYSQDGDPDENFRLAEEAFRKALELDPASSTAHNLYTYLEIEELGRSVAAMVRLLERAQVRTADPELFSALVLTCRFCGLFDASLAADRRARQLDPGIRTSVAYTYWLMGDFENAIFYDDEDIRYVRRYSLASQGKTAEAIASYRELEESRPPGMEYWVAVASRAALEGQRDECVRAADEVLRSRFHDPEGLLFIGLDLAHIGETERALAILERVVQGGFHALATMRPEPRLAPLQGEPRFRDLMRQAEAGHREALQAYERAGGPRLLGALGPPAFLG